MKNNTTYIALSVITLFFIGIVLNYNYKNKKEHQKLYSEDYVDSLHTEINVRDSAIQQFNNYIPFGCPLDSLAISSDFGIRVHPISKRRKFHEGLDLKGCYRDTVYSTAAGIIMEARRKGGYGKCVVINHNNGYQTVYAHLSKILVKKGQYVTDVAPIGKVGSTGYSTGCHLHYEIIKEGEKLNPEDFIYIKMDNF
jgi:murein DD-endopeptidase MepM/ murein hydrolase activator NlpD